VIKETDILRLKMKITDFASAVFGVGHGWLMFTEKTLFNEAMSSKEKDGHMSTMLRIACVAIAGILVFTIIKHY
jgi:hypothetical protein